MPTQEARAQAQSYEIRPDPRNLTSKKSSESSADIDYEPYPDRSIVLSPERQEVVNSICRLYSGSASEEDMQVYSSAAIYDDPWSYCDTRYKIAGQWYGTSFVCFEFHFLDMLCEIHEPNFDIAGIPKVMASSKTIKTEIVKSTPGEIIFKLQQEYTPRVLHTSKKVNSLVSLALDGDQKVKYHKDMWNEKDYSHEGLGKVMKTLNGDYLTGITQPPKDL